jgi:hypothetical protein
MNRMVVVRVWVEWIEDREGKGKYQELLRLHLRLCLIYCPLPSSDLRFYHIGILMKMFYLHFFLFVYLFVCLCGSNDEVILQCEVFCRMRILQDGAFLRNEGF